MPRSVRFRFEIGRSPRRDRSGFVLGLWCVRAPGTGCVCGVWWFSGLGVVWAGWPWGWLCRRPHGFCPPGVVGVAHSRASGVGGNHGIMRNSTISSGRGPVPMCVDPPDCTWEPDHHTQLSPEKLVIPTKTAPVPQRSRSPMCNIEDNQHPPGITRHAPHRDRSASGSRSVRLSLTKPTSRRARRARERKPHATPRNHRRAADPRNLTDLEPE